ncbi:DUF6392 family protein [Pseudomonas cichorii]|uniref:DUF6392 family protein n=1 Tax=Pseudomonas cichorii TaxID=36746 RepID=UPI001C8A761D|nr:DUF6392 family protein [Pseudomonas cichorii]MBX8483537.1 pyocin immunity protein [Pseudomonas cichorii]
MDAVKINLLIQGLGRSYEALLADGVIENSPLKPLFSGDENEDLILKPEPGIELWFWAQTRKLERIVITLSGVAKDEPVYVGELPKPFTHTMDQPSIRASLGEPYQTKGPTKLPPPIGTTGGWDAYRLEHATHANAEVVAQYLANKSVCGLAFGLINKGHD